MHAATLLSLLRRLSGVLALVALCHGAQSLAADAPAASRVPAPVIEHARGGSCVADPAFMRRNHMSLLKHQRNDTVRLGLRDPKISLRTCIACHASARTQSVSAGKDDFCQSCHAFAAVKPDCFDCHNGKAAATFIAGEKP